MSGNVIKPPSTGGSDGVNLQLIYEAAGIPPDYLTPEVVRNNIIPCVSETFSDGELVIQHAPEKDPVMREHFGTSSFGEGTFGKRLRDMLEGDDDNLRHQADGLIRFCATMFANDVANGNVILPQQLVKILQPGMTQEELLQAQFAGKWPLRDTRKSSLNFDRQTVELPQSPTVVVDYGPGVQGKYHVEEQIADYQAGRTPYTYLGIGKGPFINEFLMQYWAVRLGGAQFLGRVIGSLYIGREDGIAAASTEFVAVQKQHTGTSELADLVIASGIHTAGHEEVGVGIVNALRILKPEGTLLIRAPKASDNPETPDSVPAEDMVEMALQAGFDRKQAKFFDTVTQPDVGPRTESLSVVFRK